MCGLGSILGQRTEILQEVLDSQKWKIRENWKTLRKKKSELKLYWWEWGKMCILIEQQLLMTLIALKLCWTLLSYSVVFDSLQSHEAIHQDSLFMGILQAGMLERVAMPFFRGTSQLRYQTGVSCTAGGFFTGWATQEAQH